MTVSVEAKNWEHDLLEAASCPEWALRLPYDRGRYSARPYRQVRMMIAASVADQEMSQSPVLGIALSPHFISWTALHTAQALSATTSMTILGTSHSSHGNQRGKTTN
jgi:hypothetical protein